MKQRKILNQQTEVRLLARESGLMDAGNGKPVYAPPQVSVVHVALENGIAAASVTTTSATPQVTDWGDATTSTDDISLR